MIHGSEERKRQLAFNLQNFSLLVNYLKLALQRLIFLFLPSIMVKVGHETASCKGPFRSGNARTLSNEFMVDPISVSIHFQLRTSSSTIFLKSFFFRRKSISIKPDSRNLSQRITAKFFTGRDILQKVGSSLALN